MLKTEAEARLLECRAGNFLIVPDESYVPIGMRQIISWPRCSASDCMTGWRWAQKGKHIQNEEGIWHWTDWPPDKWTGCCGLGGKVEE